MLTCSECGSVYPGDYVTCSKCGKSLRDEKNEVNLHEQSVTVSQTSTISEPKSVAVALLLELLIPGAGFLYTKSVGRAILVFTLTFIGVFVYYSALQSMCPMYNPSIGLCSADIFTAAYMYQLYPKVQEFSVFVLIGWSILRIYGAGQLVSKYNKKK